MQATAALSRLGSLSCSTIPTPAENLHEDGQEGKDTDGAGRSQKGLASSPVTPGLAR